MSCGDSVDTAISRQSKPVKNLKRSKYADIMIKVDADVYHLDRMQLACKSDYFEKLFIEDFREKRIDFLELPIMDSDTFSTIVDMIYGQELNSVLNSDNYVLLLMAMDYLQMKIDQRVYGKFIKDFIQKKSSLDSNLFNLCEYVAENKNFDNLMPFVYTCMSAHFAKVQDREEFLSLPLDHVVGIINGQRLDFSNIKDVRQCGAVCVKWIFHDVENRLPHAIKLVNAVKRRFGFPHQINIEDFKVKMRDAGEEVTPDSVLRYFIKMMFYQGEIGMNHVVTKETMKHPPSRNSYSRIENPVDQYERDKLTRILENGDFYDIVIKIEGKTYKLHRCKLLSESGYFANVFSTEISETSDQPNNDEEYLLDVEGVDQSSFDVSIRYIYHKKLELNSDMIVGVLKTACVLKINSLIDDCESWIISNLRKISLKIVFEILNFIRNVNLIVRFESMYKRLLCQHILTAWSEIDDFSSFCAISFDMLEDLLITSVLHEKSYSSVPENFHFDDPDQLLEMCSKWVMEDVQNRYHCIPRIALAINCNLMVNCNDYKMEMTPDLSNCSEQFVRDQLLMVLSSTPLTARDTMLRNTPREIKDDPVFVASSKSIIRIFNAEMDEIVSLWLFNYDDSRDDDSFSHYSVSATTMGDNLFIAAKMANNYRFLIFFQAYNISSKKFTSLAYLPVRGNSNYVLLNCRDDIYCCFHNGLIFKYMMHFNRWTTFSESEKNESKCFLRFASDGKALYKLYETERRDENSRYGTTDKLFETYDFDQNVWIPVPEMTINGNEFRMYTTIKHLIVMKSGNVGVLLSDTFWIFDQNSRSWRQLPLPVSSDQFLDANFAAITEWENGLLLMVQNKVYYHQFPTLNQSWQLKKEDAFDYLDHEYVGCLTSIHRPN